MPAKSEAQERLMEAAAHTKGGYGGVPQSVGKEFVDSVDKVAEGNVVTEMDIAKSIRDGLMESPANIGNAWLFDIRITGTGISYRPQLDEYVFRPPEFYLCDEFLERCNGLPVIFDHPVKGMLNTDEYRDRSIGSIILPYIPSADDDKHSPTEVWGIARIYDRDAAELMMTTHISTSPAVTFDKDNMTYIRTDDGSRLLLEGKPKILDHIAVCEAGVWDKRGEPQGVNNG